MALSTTAQAKPHKAKQAARSQIVTTQRVNKGTTARVVGPTRTVVRRSVSGGRSYYYGGGGYYGGGYYPYYSSGPTFSIGIGSGYGYGSPYYGGYPYSYGYSPYSYGTHYYSNGGNVVAAVQGRLAERGYYHGAVDGVAGPRTRSAIAHWEARHGMYADGRIDRPLLHSLGLS